VSCAAAGDVTVPSPIRVRAPSTAAHFDDRDIDLLLAGPGDKSV
jgi:hypothetical protein